MIMGYSEKGKRGFQSTHCLRSHPLYSTWTRMKHRCYNGNDKYFKDYGGRGIVVCEEWKDDFVEFLYWSLKHGWEKGLTIERKNFNGNYEPSNCTWIPMSEQSKNRRGCHFVECNGERHTIAEWSRVTGISRSTLKERLNSDSYTTEEALTTPVNHNLARHKEAL
jgi:hypothetical protein